MLAPRPDDHHGPVIPPLERHALVARVALEVLPAGLCVVQRRVGDDLVLVEMNLAELDLLAVPVGPVVRRQAGIVDFAHLVVAARLVVVFVVFVVGPMIAAAAAVRVILVTSFGGSALPQRDQGEMCHAVGLLGCLEEHFRAARSTPFSVSIERPACE